MKKIVIKIIRLIVYPVEIFSSILIGRILTRIKYSNYIKVIDKLVDDATVESSEYYKPYLDKIMLLDNFKELWDFSLNEIRKEGIILEFGVWKGRSINYMSKKLVNRKFYGFDSFEGLQEDWKGHGLTKGYFNLKGKLPKVNSNVTLIKGWFSTTLP
ncbi:hypothetical protein ACFLT1_00005, partial [Bacteroidota bacterium]